MTNTNKPQSARPHPNRPPNGAPDRNAHRPPNRPPQGRRRVVLPFEKRKTDLASWAYEHQIGLLVTVVVYLLLGIVFMTAKIAIGTKVTYSEIVIDMQDMPPEPQKELTPEERKELEDDIRNARNEISNEDSKVESNKQIKGTNNPIPDHIAEQAGEVADRMRASREAYEKGLKEEQDILNSRNTGAKENNDDKKDPVKVKGNVIIEYSLPGRKHVYLHKPAYQCEGGGQVVVGITVNPNGKVISASISSTTTHETCITDRALEAAYLSSFNVDGSAPAKQQGTITYLFIPQ